MGLGWDEQRGISLLECYYTLIIGLQARSFDGLDTTYEEQLENLE